MNGPTIMLERIVHATMPMGETKFLLLCEWDAGKAERVISRQDWRLVYRPRVVTCVACLAAQ